MDLRNDVNCDVVIIGAGAAGLSAALAAKEQKHEANIIVLEKAPLNLRGGNGRYTGGAIRFSNRGSIEIRDFLPDLNDSQINNLDIPEYSDDDFFSDLMRVSQGLSDPILCETVVRGSNGVMKWLNGLGVKWDVSYDLAAKEGDRFKFLDGGVAITSKEGGVGLVEMMFNIAENTGITILYEAKAVKLLLDDKCKVCGVKVQTKEGFKNISSKAVILATGSFESNPEMRTKYLGQDCCILKVRGSRYNTGEGIKMALDIGAQPAGHWSGYHSTMVHLDSPDMEGGPETACKSYIFGIVVNINGQRFFDEGEDFYAFTYAKVGKIILTQPRAIAYQIFDAKTTPLLRSEYAKVAPIEANSIEQLAEKLDIRPRDLVKTINDFNNAVREGNFNPTILDGKCTEDISPAKSNWAQKINAPPFKAYPVTTGMTFTFGGIKCNARAQVLNTEANQIPGLYAAGEIIGGYFYYNYCGGSGITMGLVMGHIAGTNSIKDTN